MRFQQGEGSEIAMQWFIVNKSIGNFIRTAHFSEESSGKSYFWSLYEYFWFCSDKFHFSIVRTYVVAKWNFTLCRSSCCLFSYFMHFSALFSSKMSLKIKHEEFMRWKKVNFFQDIMTWYSRAYSQLKVLTKCDCMQFYDISILQVETRLKINMNGFERLYWNRAVLSSMSISTLVIWYVRDVSSAEEEADAQRKEWNSTRDLWEARGGCEKKRRNRVDEMNGRERRSKGERGDMNWERKSGGRESTRERIEGGEEGDRERGGKKEDSTELQQICTQSNINTNLCNLIVCWHATKWRETATIHELQPK